MADGFCSKMKIIKIREEKLLVCGMLEDNKRFLFLKRKDENGIERLEFPSVIMKSGTDPASLLVLAFKEKTGIDGEISDILFEEKYNSGSRKRKVLIPCLAFRFLAKNKTAKPPNEFSGFKWLTLDDAKKQKIARTSEWILKI